MEEEVHLPNWTEVQFQVFPNTFWLTTLKSFPCCLQFSPIWLSIFPENAYLSKVLCVAKVLDRTVCPGFDYSTAFARWLGSRCEQIENSPGGWPSLTPYDIRIVG